MRLMRRAATGLGAAALAAGMVTAGTVPAWAATAQTAGTAQVTSAARVTAMHEMELHAALRGSHAYPHASGTAAYESDHHGRELDVRVSHLAGLAGRHLTVYVHGVKAGTVTVTRAGSAHLQLHRGVPACHAGQIVKLRTAGGTLVASGTFRIHHHQ